MEPMLEVLQRQPDGEVLQAQAKMSRARFAVSQLTSVLVAFLTCITLLLVAVTKMNNIQDVILGPCGILSLLLKQRNSSCPPLNFPETNSESRASYSEYG